ncbi:MAG: peptide chain release factor N(5)-glutamine methyltransferase [Planctomycetota bacterium]
MNIAQTLAKYSANNQPPDMEILLAHVLKHPAIDLYKTPDRVITPIQDARFRRMLAKYKRGWPVAYLTGHKEFMSLDFLVTQDVLIPRPETELLVEEALRCVDALTHNAPRSTLYAIDIGTGSGNIAVSIIKHCAAEGLRILASDISHKALRIARLNARRHKVNKHIKFCHGDLFGPFKGIKADIIVSNPPYVDKAEKSRWQTGLKYEPPEALWADRRGLFYIEQIIKHAPDHLKPGGWLLMEIGIGQAKETMRTAKQGRCFRDIKILNDYNRIPRILMANLDYPYYP